MTARKNSGTDAVRAKIRATELMNRLQAYALGEMKVSVKYPTGELDMRRIKAIHILLNKTLPDLRATELSGNVKVDPLVLKD